MAREKIRKIIDYIGKEIEETLALMYKDGRKKESSNKEEASKVKKEENTKPSKTNQNLQ